MRDFSDCPNIVQENLNHLSEIQIGVELLLNVQKFELAIFTSSADTQSAALTRGRQLAAGAAAHKTRISTGLLQRIDLAETLCKYV